MVAMTPEPPEGAFISSYSRSGVEGHSSGIVGSRTATKAMYYGLKREVINSDCCQAGVDMGWICDVGPGLRVL
jgi:hypothetical protein